MSRVTISSCAILGLLAIAAATPVRAQTVLPKPTYTTSPTVIVGPASLNAWSPSKKTVDLSWPAVVGAQRYRLTRIDNTGTPEVTIAELPASYFVFEGATCSAGTSQPTCIFEDVTKKQLGIPRLEDLPTLDGPITLTATDGIYPHAVESGKLYTYRAWAIFPGPVLSPPSPPATVQVK